MSRWRKKLDANLPGDLRYIAEWINRAEEVLAHGININPSELTPEENLQRFTQFHQEHIVRRKHRIQKIHWNFFLVGFCG